MENGAIRSEQARQKQLQHYLGHGLIKVQGWLEPHSAWIISALGRYQATENIRGSVGEIGVHHGKLFILLDLIKADDEISFAVDLFDIQEYNIDQSGLGDLAQFKKNLENFSSGMNRVKIFKKNSMDLSADEIIASCGRTRLFSVDGGHTAACTLNDIRISEASTINEAIVVVDDYFNPSWPDVSAGTAEYILHPTSTLRPFAISPNKLYLARVRCHGRYRAVLREQMRRYYLKTSAMFGHEVDIYGYDQSTSWQRLLINRVKKGPGGALLRQIYRRYRA